jgi:hypothetical protein
VKIVFLYTKSCFSAEKKKTNGFQQLCMSEKFTYFIGFGAEPYIDRALYRESWLIGRRSKVTYNLKANWM